MIRFSFLAFGFVLAAGSAYAQCNSNPPYPTTCYLADPTYDPERRGNYVPPTCSALGTGYDSQIKAAFDCAHPRVQQDLRKLSAIFVLPQNYPVGTGKSFGMWENPTSQHVARRSYIFLSQNAFGKGLSRAESETQNAVLAATGNSLRVQYQVVPDAGALGLLSVMAHEAAHAKWYRDGVARASCYVNRIRPFWTGVPNRKWVEFADDAGSDHAPASGTRHPKRGLNEGQLHSLYPRFASVFAAISPEEDFVETYKLIALAPTRLTTFQMTTPTGASSNIKSLMTTGRLKTKVDCVLGLL